MTYPITPAHWDSQFFSFSVGNLELPIDYDKERLDTTLRNAQSAFRLLFVSVKGNGPDLLTLLGDRCPCYAHKLFFKKEVPRNAEMFDPRIRTYTSTFCIPALERLAVQSGTMSQFRQDPELATRFEQLFLTWINFAVSKELADSIWTCYEHGKHLGLVTIRCAKQVNSKTGQMEREGRIGMLAVDAQYRRQGIGTELVRTCDFWCSSLDIPVGAVVTQKENLPAIELFKKNGFYQDHETSVYHYWSPGWLYDTHRGWIHSASER